jgi:hypothetical protein
LDADDFSIVVFELCPSGIIIHSNSAHIVVALGWFFPTGNQKGLENATQERSAK